MTTANDLHFGVEFETTLPNSDRTPIGGYHHGTPVAWLPDGWKAEKDSSIKTVVGRKGCEFVSPKLRGLDGLRQVESSIDAINRRAAKVNPSCGMHVTVEWNGDAAALARLISLVGNHEKAIFASTGTRRRESTVYCKPVKQYGNKDAAKGRCDADRYHLLNLTHVARGHNRIEFRAFAGTLNKEKAIGYVMLCLALVELALNANRCLAWDYTKQEGKKSSWERLGAGDGETELNRLFYRLGWTSGKAKQVYGQPCEDGQSVDRKSIMAKLRDLARKYDAA
jgi:hypothetical protein